MSDKMNHMIECSKLSEKLVNSISQKIIEDVGITRELAEEMKRDFLYDTIFEVVREAYTASDFILRHPDEDETD